MAKKIIPHRLTKQLQDRNFSKKKSRIEEHLRSQRALSHSTKPPHLLPSPVNKTDISIAVQQLKDQGFGNIENKLEYPEWNTLNGIFDQMSRGIYEFSTAVAANFQVVEESGKSDQTLRNIVQVTLNDCNKFSQELVEIKSRYEGREGKLTSTEELDLYYSIGDSYHSLFDRFQILSFQSATEITSYLSAAHSETTGQNLEEAVNEAINTISEASEVSDTSSNEVPNPEA